MFDAQTAWVGQQTVDWLTTRGAKSSKPWFLKVI